ncbi:kinesin motor domain-containing protein, partial [Gorgonomyces haynaldii]
IPKNEEWGYINNQQENWDFKFDNILHNASQEVVYEECAIPIVKSLLDGYNATILAYGQTGAGKTFTMTGATENYKHRGLIPRAISQLFHEIADRPQLAFTVRVSYLEIYNEQMVDLLGTLGDKKHENMTVVEEKSGATHVKGLNVQLANNEEEALNLLFEGETNRSISEHQLNRASSRSHCIFTIYVESRSRVESSERVLTSKLNLVDLAGSERLSKTETKGITFKEAMYINRSLTYLEQVIIALSDKKRDHIPFRQSKMTHVLRDSLGGNCNTLMIANVWGEREHIEETIS